jgi:hypothetical protein
MRDHSIDALARNQAPYANGDAQTCELAASRVDGVHDVRHFDRWRLDNRDVRDPATSLSIERVEQLGSQVLRRERPTGRAGR